MRLRVWVLAALTTSILGACTQESIVDFAVEESAIREVAEGSLLSAAIAGDLDGVLDAYARGAVMMPPGAASQRGRDALRTLWASYLALPGINFKRMDEVTIEFSDSGDMAYSLGGYELSYLDADGN